MYLVNFWCLLYYFQDSTRLELSRTIIVVIQAETSAQHKASAPPPPKWMKSKKKKGPAKKPKKAPTKSVVPVVKKTLALTSGAAAGEEKKDSILNHVTEEVTIREMFSIIFNLSLVLIFILLYSLRSIDTATFSLLFINTLYKYFCMQLIFN